MFREAPYYGRLDEVLRQLGTLGAFNIRNYALLLLPAYIAGLYGHVFVFEVLDIDYRCKIKECEGTGNSAEWKPFALPPSDYHAGYSRCSRYTARGVLVLGQPTCIASLFTTKIVPCKELVYNEKTAVKDFNLGCRPGTKATIAALHNLGVFISLSYAGYVADRFGRKVALAIASLMTFIFGLLRSFSVNFFMLMALEFLEAGLGAGAYSTAFFFAMEIVGPENRIIFGIIINTVHILGTTSLGILAWILADWRLLLRFIYIPVAVLVLLYIWILDESVRWLLAKGRNDEAIAILKKAAKMNHVTLVLTGLTTDSEKNANSEQSQSQLSNSSQMSEEQSPEKRQKSSARQVYESSEHSKTLASCSLLWFTCTFIYFSLSLNSVFIDGNKYINYVMVSFIELPAYFACLAALHKYGRRRVITYAFFLGAIACIGLAVIPMGHPRIFLSIYLTAKFFLTIAYVSIYFFVSEAVPAHLREFLLSVCSKLGRLGSVLAPFTPLLAVYYYNLPAILFGTLAGAAVFTLTVTMGTEHRNEQPGEHKHTGNTHTKNDVEYDVQRKSTKRRIINFQIEAIFFR